MGERAKLTDHRFLIRMAGVALGPCPRDRKNLKAKRFYVDTIFKNGGRWLGWSTGLQMNLPSTIQRSSKSRAKLARQFANRIFQRGKSDSTNIAVRNSGGAEVSSDPATVRCGARWLETSDRRSVT